MRPVTQSRSFSDGALAGLRVVEICEGMAGPYAAKLLAGYGAEVIKVEPPLGDRTRAYAPGLPGQGEGGLFAYLNGGKKSICLDLDDGAHRDIVEQLIVWCDLLLVSGSPAWIIEKGLTYEGVRSLSADTVATSVTPFGLESPYRDHPAHDLNHASLGSVTVMIGDPERAPLNPPYDLSAYQVGIAAASASLLALFQRRQDGLGQQVDVCALDVWGTVHQGSALMNRLVHGTKAKRAGRRRRDAYPFQLMNAKDGLMCMITRDGRQWQRFIEHVVADPALLTKRYQDRRSMGFEYPDEVDALLEPWFAARTRGEIFQLCRENHVPFAPVRTMSEVAQCDQLAERGFFVDVSGVRLPGAPARFSVTPWIGGARGPKLDEHRDEILRHTAEAKDRSKVKASWATPTAARPDVGGRSAGPLSGVRVLDLSWVLAGPVVGRLMADAGAEIIKLESSGRLDSTRLGRAIETGAPSSPRTDRVPLFHVLNAGKQSIDVNLRDPAAVDVVKRLVANCDVVVENFAPGVLARLGLDESVLRSANPDVVVLSMSGAGQFGPLSDITAYAPTVTSLAGLESLVGYRGEEAIGMLGSNFADSVGGLYGFHSVLVALWAKAEIGVGQHIDYSEMEGIVTMLAEPLLELAATGNDPIPDGNTHRHGAPYGVFPVNSPDQWVAIAVTNDDEWMKFCRATPDAPWARDTSLQALDVRQAKRELLEEQVVDYTRQRSAEDLVRSLRAAGVAANMVAEVGDQVSDPHFAARGLFPTITGVPDVDSLTVYGSPWLLSRTPVGPRMGGPRLGADTMRVLTSVAGMASDEVSDLLAQAVLHQP